MILHRKDIQQMKGIASMRKVIRVRAIPVRSRKDIQQMSGTMIKWTKTERLRSMGISTVIDWEDRINGFWIEGKRSPANHVSRRLNLLKRNLFVFAPDRPFICEARIRVAHACTLSLVSSAKQQIYELVALGKETCDFSLVRIEFTPITTVSRLCDIAGYVDGMRLMLFHTNFINATFRVCIENRDDAIVDYLCAYQLKDLKEMKKS